MLVVATGVKLVRLPYTPALALVLQLGGRREFAEVYPTLLACTFGTVLFSLLVRKIEPGQ